MPLILHNSHRYFLYVALLFPIFLAYDVWNALWFTDAATGATSFGLGVGTLVLAVNVVLLSGYALGLPFTSPPCRRHSGPPVGVAGAAEGV